jgi:hypothetical protein
MKQKYNHDTLLDDIHGGFEEMVVNVKASDKAKRENKHKLLIMQMLIKLAQVYSGEEYDDDVKLCRDIETKLNGNELLSGFLFFVSLNPQFDYSWNYMRKRKLSYADFLVDAIRFMNNVVADINVLAEDVTNEKDIHVVMDDLFDVELGNMEPYVKTKFKWENLHNMVAVKKEYSIRVCKKDNALATGSREDVGTVTTLKALALRRLANSKESTK